MKIALATTSKYKIHAVKGVIHELEFDCEIDSVNAESEISDQPHSKNETMQGSINRSKNALKLSETSDIGLGVEFGYEPFEDGTFHMVCWAAIATRNGEIFTAHSSSLELPKLLTEALISNTDVGTVFDKEIKNMPKEFMAVDYFVAYMRKRQPIQECTRNVLIRYLLSKEY